MEVIMAVADTEVVEVEEVSEEVEVVVEEEAEEAVGKQSLTPAF